MDELAVGMYVRTKYGEICKLIKSKTKYFIYLTDIEIDRNEDRACNNYGFTENELEDIIKASYNITDLIEVEDYVNGSKVIKIEEYNGEKYIYVEETEFCNACNEVENIYYKEDTIKSLVTREMFEQMKYEVK